MCLYAIYLLLQTGAISQEETTMNRISADVPVLVAGGGIGGLAAALALTRQGFAVKVLEQAPQLGEIGAGIQLGPNGFAAFDALGIGEKARGRAVYTDEMVMHDALDETLIGRIPTGEAFRQRFGNPYAVIHRADVHKSLLEGAQESDRIEVLTSTTVQRVDQDDDGVTVHDTGGGKHCGIALIGAGLGALVARVAWTQFQPTDPPAFVIIVLAILGAIGAMVLQRYIIVVGTALVGAWSLILGVMTLTADRSAARSGAAGNAWILYPFAPASGQRWVPLAFIALGVVGMVVQLGVTGRKRVPA